MTYFRPHHPASKSKYMKMKSFHKEDICHGKALCKIHNTTYAYKLADKDHQVNCKKCLRKMYSGQELVDKINDSQKEKCFNCGSLEFSIVRDMTSKRVCSCGHSWDAI